MVCFFVVDLAVAVVFFCGDSLVVAMGSFFVGGLWCGGRFFIAWLGVNGRRSRFFLIIRFGVMGGGNNLYRCVCWFCLCVAGYGKGYANSKEQGCIDSIFH